MRYLRLLVVLAAAWCSAGCYVISLSGLADASTSTLDEALLGRWKSAEDEAEIELARDEWHAYAATLRDRFGEQKFTARLAEIGKSRYFDVTLHAGTDSGPVLLPVHVLGRVSLDEGTLRIELLDYEWFRRRVGAGTSPVAATLDSRQNVLLIASVERLRKWLGAHVGAPLPFTEFMTLTRVPNAPPD